MAADQPAEHARIEQGGLLAEAASRWGLPAERVEHVGDSESLAFRIGAPPTGAFLRFVAKRRRTADQIEAELAFQAHLRRSGVSVSEPVPSRTGRAVEGVGDEDGYWVCVFRALPGRHIDWRRDDLDSHLMGLWGAALGRIHRASRELHADPPLARPRWDEDPIVTRAMSGEPRGERAAVARLREGVAALTGYEPDPSSFGLVHGDFGFRNFLIEPDSTVHAIDFDDCGYHWYAADVAFALWPARNAPALQRRRVLEWFLSGYRSECDLDAIWESRFSELIRFRTAYLYLLFAGGSWDRIKHPQQSQWLERTRAGFDRRFEW